MTTLPTIRHHLNDALLMGYAAGHLSEAFALVVATHVTMCDDCRARLESYEALGGAVIEAEDETAVSTDALRDAIANACDLNRLFGGGQGDEGKQQGAEAGETSTELHGEWGEDRMRG